LCDAQTSGGLLISVAEGRAENLLTALRESGVSEAAWIGRVSEKGEGNIYVRHGKELTGAG